MMKDKPDIFTTRPANEKSIHSRIAIAKELKEAGLKVAEIYQGSTQPNGSTIWYVDLED